MIELLLEAESALSLGMLDRAEILYRQVAGADPRNSIAVVGLARVMLERGDEPGALKLARRGLVIDPENTAAQRMVQRLEEVLRYRGTEVAPAPAPTVPAPAPARSAGPDAAHAPTTPSVSTGPVPTTQPVQPAPTTAPDSPAPTTAPAADTERIAQPDGPPPVSATPSRSFVDRLFRRR